MSCVLWSPIHIGLNLYGVWSNIIITEVIIMEYGILVPCESILPAVFIILTWSAILYQTGAFTYHTGAEVMTLTYGLRKFFEEVAPDPTRTISHPPCSIWTITLYPGSSEDIPSNIWGCWPASLHCFAEGVVSSAGPALNFCCGQILSTLVIGFKPLTLTHRLAMQRRLHHLNA